MPNKSAALKMLTNRDWMAPVAPKLTNGWGMMLNDTLGDCTCAAWGTVFKLLTGVSGAPVTPTDAEIATMYQASGWDPNNSAATDNGWFISDALDYWMENRARRS